MDITLYQQTVIGAVAALSGAVLGSLVTYSLARQLLRDSEKRKSARRLHEAFRDEYLLLNPAESKIPDNLSQILESAFDKKHRAAVYDYSQYLSNCEHERFMNAWHDYIRPPNWRSAGWTVATFSQYGLHGRGVEGRREAIEAAKANIKRVLSHAKL